MDKKEYYLRRYKKARSTADLWISILEACYHYTIPSRNLFYWTSQYQGAQKNARVYDTTAVAALKTFVSKIHSSLTPPQQTWALLEAGNEVEEGAQEAVNAELQIRTEIIFDYLRRSNFDLVINECYYDLGVGTACLVINEGTDENPFYFNSVPLARLAPEQSFSGLLDSGWRWWDEIRIADIQLMWPGAELTPMMKELYRNDPNASVKELIDGCIDNNPHQAKKKGKKGRDFPYTYIVMHQDEIMLEVPMDRNPLLIFRWSKINNEIMGRGPVIEALPSILSLNEVARLELTSANMNISKPIMAYSDGVFNPWTFKLEPNTIIPIAPNTAGQFPLQPFPDTANPQFMQFTSNDLRMQINKLMYADPLGPVEGPNKTATELAIRQRNLLDEIGPGFTRLQQEFMPRLIESLIQILTKKGLMKDLVIDGKKIQIRYKSPLTLSQGQVEVANLTQWVQLMQGVFGPESTIPYLNPVRAPAWLANKMGVDLEPLNTSEEMEALFAQESEKMQLAEMEMMGGEGGESIPAGA